MDSVTIEAPAKLNLCLMVGPLRGDGYHPIRSLMVTLHGLVDTVTVTRASERSVVCAGIDGRDNLAWRALDGLERSVGRALPCTVRIDKQIPIQAGLGGGSSDAAATLVGADRLFSLGLTTASLERIAAEIGSDVPFFVRGGGQWAGGRGERLVPAAVPEFAAVVVKPPFGLSTADVYAAFDALPVPEHGQVTPPPLGMPQLATWVRNDLWPPALSLRPELGTVAADLRAVGARAVLLCGSGAAVAGLFDVLDAARGAAAQLGDGSRQVFVVRAAA